LRKVNLNTVLFKKTRREGMISRRVFGEIARHFGTPVYIYNKEIILEKIRALMQAFTCPSRVILFAMKANANFELLKILKSCGFGIDAVSPVEIALARKLGFVRVVFTGNNVSNEEFDFALQDGAQITIDSLSGLDRFGQKFPSWEICLRLNLNIGAGHHQHCITGGPESKFGIPLAHVDEAKRIAGRHNLKIVGLHQHIGSQILDPEIILLAMEELLKVALQFPDLGLIDFGGGFGVPYRPKEKPLDIMDLGRRMSQRFNRFCEDEYRKRLCFVIEPGRFLVAESGYLLVRVIDVKRNPDGRVFVGVDSGFCHLDRPARYGAYHRIANISNPDGPRQVVDVVGNLCESGDKFAVQRRIRQAREGDLLLIHTAGAYGFSMSSNYNCRLRPAEIMVAGPEVTKIREGEHLTHFLGYQA